MSENETMQHDNTNAGWGRPRMKMAKPDVDTWAEQNSGQADSNGVLYYKLSHAISNRRFDDIRYLISAVLRRRAWERWRWIGNEFGAGSFAEYLTASPPKGIGATVKLVGRLVQDDPELDARFRQATVGKVGRPDKETNDNIIIKHNQGTSRAYTLDRLERERPDLFAKVCAGKLSANAAAIEAGFRKKLTAFERIERLLPKLTQRERKQLKRML